MANQKKIGTKTVSRKVKGGTSFGAKKGFTKHVKTSRSKGR